jgi:hypothetical protein
VKEVLMSEPYKSVWNLDDFHPLGEGLLECPIDILGVKHHLLALEQTIYCESDPPDDPNGVLETWTRVVNQYVPDYIEFRTVLPGWTEDPVMQLVEHKGKLYHLVMVPSIISRREFEKLYPFAPVTK